MVKPWNDPGFEASLSLPPDALHLLRCSTGRPSTSSWVLLDSLAYMVPPRGVRNHTTAQTLMRDGRTIQVTFLMAGPPRRSYWCISVVCPDSAAEGDSDQDQGQDDDDDNPFDSIPKIVSSTEDLALIRVGLTTCDHWLWFVYSAQEPSLVLLPDIHENQHLMEPYGIVPSPDKNGFVVAALSRNYKDGDDQYNLHVLSSAQSTWTWNPQPLAVDYGWTRKPCRLYPTKVTALGDGVLGWVDLWEGILVCDVRAGAATAARFVPMPRPLPNNQELYRKDDSSAQPLRDVALDHGHIRCVEIEQLLRPKPRAAPVVHDPSDLLLLFDSQAPMVPEDDEYEAVGWRLVTWFRALTWGHWQRGTILHSDQLASFSWKDLETCTPVLCDDDVYLTSMLKNRRPQDKTAWMVAVDTKTKSLPSSAYAILYRQEFTQLPKSHPMRAHQISQALDIFPFFFTVRGQRAAFTKFLLNLLES